MGNTDVYGGISTAANRRAMPVTFTETGEIQSISIYHNGGTGNVLLGVYSDQTGLPVSKLGVSASTVINVTAGWQTVSLTSPVPVSSGQKVWLVWVFQNSIGVRYTAGTPGRSQSIGTWPGGMPATFGASTIADNKFSIYCSYTPGIITTATLGNMEVYTGISTAANRRAIPVTFTEAGMIQSISIYHNGGTGNVLLGVYSDVSGLPSSQLGVTTSTVVNTIAGWQSVSLSSPVTVTSGQTIWLSWVFQNSIGVRYTAGTPGRAQSTATWSSGMPATFGGAASAGNIFSIYCTYTPIAEVQQKSAGITVNADVLSNNKDELLIYPNPTTGEVHLKFNNPPDENSYITVFNISGRLISKIQVEGEEQSINLKGNSPGIYFIKIVQNGSKTYKLVLH